LVRVVVGDGDAIAACVEGFGDAADGGGDGVGCVFEGEDGFTVFDEDGGIVDEEEEF
jgi:hypothetical protein